MQSAFVVTSVVRVPVPVPVTLRQNFLEVHSLATTYDRGYVQTWTIGTLEGWLSFHCIGSPGSCQGVGLEVKIFIIINNGFSVV